MRVPDPKANTTTEAYLAYKAGYLEQSELKPVLYEPYLHFDAWLAYWAGLTSDYPHEIGKNLVDYLVPDYLNHGAVATISGDSVTFTKDSDGVYRYSILKLTAEQTAKILGNTITISYNQTTSIPNVLSGIRLFWIGSGSNPSSLIYNGQTTGNGDVSFTTTLPDTPPDSEYPLIALTFYPDSTNTVVADSATLTISNLQLEIGETATEYEPYSLTAECLTDEEALVAYLSGVTNTYPEEIKDPYDVRIVGYLKYLVSARWGRPEYPVNNEEFYLSTMKPPVVPSGDPSSSIDIEGTAEAPFLDLKMYGDTYQNGTPTPDAPIIVQTVTGEQVVDVSGKNLLKFTSENVVPSSAAVSGANITIEDNSLHFVAFDSVGSGTQYAYYYTGELDPDVTYTISGIAKKIAVASTMRAIYSYSDDGETWASNTNIFNVTDAEPGTTVNLSHTFSGHKFYRFGFYNTFASVISGTETIYYNMQIEQGSTATEYIPYHQSQSYTISLGSTELCKIDRTQGYFQDYIYRDGEDWYLYKETGKIVFDGTEDWAYDQNYSRVVLDNIPNIRNSRARELRFFCSHFEVIYDRRPVTQVVVNECYSGSSSLYIHTSMTLADFKAFLAAQYNAGTPVMIAYPLETPTDTQITNSELIAQLDALMEGGSYEGETRIRVSATDPNLPGLLYVEAAKYD